MAPAMCLENTNRPLTTAAWEPGTATTVLGVTSYPSSFFCPGLFSVGISCWPLTWGHSPSCDITVRVLAAQFRDYLRQTLSKGKLIWWRTPPRHGHLQSGTDCLSASLPFWNLSRRMVPLSWWLTYQLHAQVSEEAEGWRCPSIRATQRHPPISQPSRLLLTLVYPQPAAGTASLPRSKAASRVFCGSVPVWYCLGAPPWGQQMDLWSLQNNGGGGALASSAPNRKLGLSFKGLAGPRG